MSILINMEMPTGCSALTLKVWPDGQVEIIDADGEWKTSKAISVPPHGDLVDRDEIIEAGKSHPEYKNSKILKAVVDKACGLLKTATVVIPANKE